MSSHSLAAHLEAPLSSCHVAEQRVLADQTGGNVTDVGQAHIAARADVLIEDINSLRMSRKISKAAADKMTQRVKEIRLQGDKFVAQQGFLSAGEKASFDREFDGMAGRICN